MIQCGPYICGGLKIVRYYTEFANYVRWITTLFTVFFLIRNFWFCGLYVRLDNTTTIEVRVACRHFVSAAAPRCFAVGRLSNGHVLEKP